MLYPVELRALRIDDHKKCQELLGKFNELFGGIFGYSKISFPKAVA